VERGIIFTYDAMLALAIVITLLSGAVLISTADSSQGIEQNLLYNKAADTAILDFYSGAVSSEAPSTGIERANCEEILEYKENGDIAAKVKKCAE